MANKPAVFNDVPDEYITEIVREEELNQDTRIGCMRWIRNEPDASIWQSEAPLGCCCWVWDGLTRMQLRIANGQQLRLRNGQGLTAC